MDHLPYPNLGVPPIVVPYLSDFEYDGEDFATFPKRIGFWKDGRLDLDRPCRQLAALAQAWLFFGLIDVFTRQSVDRGALIRKGDNNRVDESVIDTTALGEIISERFRRLRLLFLSSEVLKGIRAQLMEAARASSTLDRIQTDDSPSSAVFLSIKILIIYLSEMFNAAFWPPFCRKLPLIPSGDSFRYGILGTKRPDGGLPAPAHLLMNRMRQSGWCIHQIVEVFRTHNYCIAYYYSSIPRVESWDDITHEACTEAHCVAYNIKDDSAYKIRHIEGCSGCELVGPPEDEVANIVRGGDIPLVELNPTSLENQTQLQVRPATSHSRYTAISHVWIDGHGNPTANTLPTCQLQRLAARLSAISNAQQSWVSRLWQRLRYPSPRSHLMWMDTLCIPPQRDTEDQKVLRKKAIHRMALIYVGAKQVLVLDTELNKFIHDGNPRELIDALISCSRWNSRCWTLEEGALAQKCLFQFKDVAREMTLCPIPMPQAFFTGSLKTSLRMWCDFFKSSSEGILPRPLPYVWPPFDIYSDFAHEYLCRELAMIALRSTQMDISRASHAAKESQLADDLQVDRLVRTWNDIGRRSTTRPEDVHPIIANLTDFSAAQIMALETPVLRTKTIVHCIGRFPLDVLWAPCARPQAHENSADRWVPSIPGPEPLVERVKLRSTDEGLVVDSENRSKPPETFWIPGGMVAPRFCFLWSRNDQEELWYVVDCMIAGDDALPRGTSETACLILSPDEGATAASEVLQGARLLVTEGDFETSQSLYLRYDCPLTCTIRRHTSEFEQIPDTPIMEVHKVSGSRKFVIESSFDLKDREKFHMRSRDFYQSLRKRFVDIIIYYFSGLPAISLMLLVSPVSLGGSWDINAIVLMLGTLMLSNWMSILLQFFIKRWMYSRAYNTWKKTFEEDWRPKDSFFRRFVKAARLSPRRIERDKNREERGEVNV